MEILEKIYVSGGRAFKTNKHQNPVEVNTMEPFQNIEILSHTMDGEGDSIVLKIDDFKIPVSRVIFLSFLKSVTVQNGFIVEPCVIVGSTSSFFALLNINSTEYIELHTKYEILKEDKRTRFSKYDVNIGDIITLMAGKKKEKNLVFLGEFHTLPFNYKALYNYGREGKVLSISLKDKMQKKFIFAKVSNSKVISEIFIYSSFPTVTEKTGVSSVFSNTKEITDSIEHSLKERLSGCISERNKLFKNHIPYRYFSVNISPNNSLFLKIYNNDIKYEDAKEELLSLFIRDILVING